MVEKLFDSETFLSLKKALDAAALRQKVIANNIANVETPGFKRADVTFEHELTAALEKAEEATKLNLVTTDSKHITNKPRGVEQVQPQIVEQKDTSFRLDESNVDIDAEMAKLAENNIAYNTLAQLINEKLRMLRSVVQEGRGG